MIDARFANRRKGQRWWTCDVCGVDYPQASIVVQNGSIRCVGQNTNNCYDEPGAAYYRKNVDLTERPDPDPANVDVEL